MQNSSFGFWPVSCFFVYLLGVNVLAISFPHETTHLDIPVCPEFVVSLQLANEKSAQCLAFGRSV